MDKFGLDSQGYHGQIKIDTNFYDNGKIKATGSYAIDRDGKKSKFRTGKWITYYENGQIKSTGYYQMGYLLACVSARMRLEYYDYRTGGWIYYYENGQLMAEGRYKFEKVKIYTGVADQFANKAILGEDWNFYDDNGQQASDKQKIIGRVEKLQ